MKRTKFTVGLRNRIAEMITDFDSAACIEDGGMSGAERESYQESFRKILKKLDKSLFPKDGKKKKSGS